MTVFVSDTFTDTENTLLENHTPETGGAWSKRSGAGSVKIVSNTAEPTTTWVYYTNAAAPGSNEYEVYFDAIDSSSQGLLVRYVDSSNWYRVHYDHSYTKYYFAKRVANVFTLLETLNEADPAEPYEMKFECKSAAKKLYIDDVEKLSSADDTLKDTGNAGIVLSYSGGDAGSDTNVDDFVADDVGEPVAETASMQPIHHWWPR